jgi:hypothetical protein
MRLKSAGLALVFLLVFAAPAAADTVSADEIEYTGNVEGFQGNVFSMFFVADASTEDIQAFISPDELSEAAGENNQVQQSIEISAKQTQHQARYNIRATDRTPVRDLEVVKQRFDTRSQRNEFIRNRCVDADGSGSNINDALKGSVPALGIPPVDYTVVCWGSDRGTGRWEVFDLEDNPDTAFQTEWRVKASGQEEETATLSNSEIGAGRVARIGENTQIEWQGNLDTGQNPPGTSDYLVLKNTRGTGEFKLVRESEYDQYLNFISNTQSKIELVANCDQSLIEQTFQGGACLPEDETESNLENLVGQATQPVADAPIAEDAGFRDGEYVKNLGYNPSYPAFNVYVDGADYVKVEKTRGEPKILSIDAPGEGSPLQEGQGFSTGRVEVNVKNTGEAPGSFYSRVRGCGGEFTATSGSNTKEVQPGGIASFTHEIGFGSSGNISKDTVLNECEYEVVDTASGEEVTQNFGVAAEPADTCNAGGYFTRKQGDRTQILQNSDDCDSIREVEVCSADEYVQTNPDNSLECAAGNQPSVTDDPCQESLFGTGLITYKDPLCQEGFSGAFGVSTGEAVKYLVVLIATIYGFGIGHSNLSRFAEISNERTRVVLGALVAGLTGLVTFGVFDIVAGFVFNPVGLIVTVLLVIGLGYLLGPLSALKKAFGALRGLGSGRNREGPR